MPRAIADTGKGRVFAAWRLLLGLSVVLAAGTASAVPLDIAGFGDSIACDSCNDGSYLSLLDGYLPEAPTVQDHGLPAETSGDVLDRLDIWLTGGGTADWVILLAGTPDTYQEVGGFNNVAYSEAAVIDNFDDMIDLVLGISASVLVVAPPPVQPNCDGAGVLITCTDIDNRLNSLSIALAGLASSKSVGFVDLYDAFVTHPDFGEVTGSALSLFQGDGLHPKYATGDELIALEIASAIPEPSTALLACLGLIGLGTLRRSS